MKNGRSETEIVLAKDFLTNCHCYAPLSWEYWNLPRPTHPWSTEFWQSWKNQYNGERRPCLSRSFVNKRGCSHCTASMAKNKLTSTHLTFYFFKKKILFILRERGREKERERNTDVRNKLGLVALTRPQLGTWPAVQACALTGNWTGDLRFVGRCPTHWAKPGRANPLLLTKVNSKWTMDLNVKHKTIKSSETKEMFQF